MRFPFASRFCVVFCLLFSVWARAETPSQLENPLKARRSWVSDGAGVIDSQTQTRINALLNRLYQTDGAEIAVVTVRNLGGQDVKAFANDLFQRWGIGKKGRDNGILILAAIDDRKYWVEVGYGLEATLTDGQAGAIARETLPPAFRRGDYSAGLLSVTAAIVGKIAPALVQNAAPTAPNAPSGSTSPRTIPQAPPSAPFPGSDPNFPPVLAPNFSGLWLIFLTLGGGVGLLIYFTSRPPRCEKCRGEMDQLNDDQVHQMLSEGQQFEEEIQSRDYQIWRCKSCTHQQMRVVGGGRSFGRCPRCNLHSLASQTQILQYPTEWSTGLEVTTEACLWPRCRYRNQRRRTLARRPSVQIITGGGFGGGFGGSSGGSSRSSGGSSGGGPGSFGGGSSGGGGAGGSW